MGGDVLILNQIDMFAGTKISNVNTPNLVPVVNNFDAFRPLLDFSKPEYVYIMMLKRRRKDIGGSYEISDEKSGAARLIIRNDQDYELCFNELIETARGKGFDSFRIYISINPRSSIKAYRALQNDIFKAFSTPHMFELLNNFPSEFKSTLHRPRSRAHCNYMLLDCDMPRLSGEFINKVGELTKVVLTLKSRTGWHLIVKPFNPFLLKVSQLEVKSDAMTNILIV